MLNDFYNEPLVFSDPKPRKPSQGAWLDVNIPQKLQIHGQTRSGKGTTIAWIIWRLFGAGIFICHAFSAGGFENLYYVMNKNCKLRWQNIFKISQLLVDNESQIKFSSLQTLTKIQENQLMGLLSFMKSKKWCLANDDYSVIESSNLTMGLLRNPPLHCNCEKAMKAFVMIPHYYKLKKIEFQRFNGEVFDGYDEYNEAYMNSQVNEWLPETFDFFNNPIPKPPSLMPIPKLKYAQFVPPTEKGLNKIEKFRVDFRKMVEIAKPEHRILIHSPQFYPLNSQGKREKYGTVAEIFRGFEEFTQTALFSKVTNKPRERMTKWEKSNHKLALMTNEARAFAPSQRLSGDSESSVSKKAFFNYLPENRHKKSWVVWDLQSSSDLNIGSRNQTDFTIMKRSTDKLLGEEWKWFADKVDKIILKIVEPMGFQDVENLPARISQWLLKRKHLCRVYELPDNYGYIIWENGEFRLKKFDMDYPWHHKSDQDNFVDDSGINLTVDWKKFNEGVSKTQKSSNVSATSKKNQFYQEVSKRLKSGDNYQKIIDDLKDDANYNFIKWDSMNSHKLSNNFKYWENAQAQSRKNPEES